MSDDEKFLNSGQARREELTALKQERDALAEQNQALAAENGTLRRLVNHLTEKVAQHAARSAQMEAMVQFYQMDGEGAWRALQPEAEVKNGV